MGRAYAIMSGRLSPAGVLKGLLEDGRRGSDGTLGGGGGKKTERGGEATRKRD